MREILFRGKRINGGKWVDGYLLKITLYGKTWNLILGDNFIRSGLGVTAMQHATVDPSTVGQDTGLKDKNGVRIFEGDIIRWLPALEEKTDVVSFDEAGFCAGEYFLQSALYYGDFDGEVIGNIHDNPELLGGNNG